MIPRHGCLCGRCLLCRLAAKRRERNTKYYREHYRPHPRPLSMTRRAVYMRRYRAGLTQSQLEEGERVLELARIFASKSVY